MTTTSASFSTAGTKARSTSRITAADIKTAQALKTAIVDQLAVVRLAPIDPKDAPTLDAKSGLQKAPNGHLLFGVLLSSPPAGSFDMPQTWAYVDPLTNRYYYGMMGGLAGGLAQFSGPLNLPGLAFKGKKYSVAQLKALEKAAAKQPKTKLYHFEPTVFSASYSPGMGMRPPPGVDPGPKVTVNVLFPYIDIKPSWEVAIDEKKHTMTVVLDGTSTTTNHPLAPVKPQDLIISVARPADIGKTYTLLIKDIHGKTLNSSEFGNVLPA